MYLCGTGLNRGTSAEIRQLATCPAPYFKEDQHSCKLYVLLNENIFFKDKMLAGVSSVLSCNEIYEPILVCSELESRMGEFKGKRLWLSHFTHTNSHSHLDLERVGFQRDKIIYISNREDCAQPEQHICWPLKVKLKSLLNFLSFYLQKENDSELNLNLN